MTGRMCRPAGPASGEDNAAFARRLPQAAGQQARDPPRERRWRRAAGRLPAPRQVQQRRGRLGDQRACRPSLPASVSISLCRGLTSSTGAAGIMARPARRIRRCICRSGPLARRPPAPPRCRSAARWRARRTRRRPAPSFIAASSGEMSGSVGVLAEVVRRLGDAAQLLALEAVQPFRPERVDRIGHQQHLDALGAEAFKLRRRLQRLGVVAGQVLDRVLAGLHARRRSPAARSSPPASRTGTAAAARVSVRCSVSSQTPSFSSGAEILPEFRVVLGFLGAGLQLGQHAADQRLADAAEHRRGLQHLARDVQRQVLGIHHAADEAQPVRQQLGLVGDEHAPDMQPDMRRRGRPRRGSNGFMPGMNSRRRIPACLRPSSAAWPTGRRRSGRGGGRTPCRFCSVIVGRWACATARCPRWPAGPCRRARW